MWQQSRWLDAGPAANISMLLCFRDAELRRSSEPCAADFAASAKCNVRQDAESLCIACPAENERVRIQELSRQQVSPLQLVTGGASATGPAAALGLLQVWSSTVLIVPMKASRACRRCIMARQMSAAPPEASVSLIVVSAIHR